jgi:predicted GNAT superfamily acetyltransferase
MTIPLEHIAPADIPEGTPLARALLALNNAHAVELSWLEPQQLRHLVAQAFLAIRIGSADALLLALDQDADYASPNFLWMRSRFDRFVYVDRIVVAAHARGRGHARRLYDKVFARAAEAGHERVVCEVNADPPNPASDVFHAALGFEPVGSAIIHDCGKTVRYLVRPLR